MTIVEIFQIDDTKLWKYPKINWRARSLWPLGHEVRLAVTSVNEPNYLGLVAADFEKVDDCRTITVTEIEVHPSYQRRGVATALLKALVARDPNAHQLDMVELMPDGWALAHAFSAESVSRDDYDVVVRIDPKLLARHESRARLVALNPQE